MSAVEFGELPPRRYGGAATWSAPAAAQLRERPGEWARVRTVDSVGLAGKWVQLIKSGHSAAFSPAGAFESASRTRTDRNGRKVYDLWARYVGAPATKKPSAVQRGGGQKRVRRAHP